MKLGRDEGCTCFDVGLGLGVGGNRLFKFLPSPRGGLREGLLTLLLLLGREFERLQ